MEYLERDAVIAAVDKHLNTVLNKASDKTQLDCGIAAGYDMAHRHCIDVISTIPAADVRPVVRGKWIGDKVAFYRGCPECGCYLEYAVDTFLDNGDHYNFCPNCGADMREETE